MRRLVEAKRRLCAAGGGRNTTARAAAAATAAGRVRDIDSVVFAGLAFRRLLGWLERVGAGKWLKFGRRSTGLELVVALRLDDIVGGRAVVIGGVVKLHPVSVLSVLEQRPGRAEDRLTRHAGQQDRLWKRKERT